MTISHIQAEMNKENVIDKLTFRKDKKLSQYVIP